MSRPSHPRPRSFKEEFVANRLYDFIAYLLESRDHRLQFFRDPEGLMNARGLTDRFKQMTLFTMDRQLICRYLLDEERHEPDNPHDAAAYEALVARIVNPYIGYDFDADAYPPFFAAETSPMAAAAWSEPEPRVTGVAPMSDAAATAAKLEIEVSGEGLHHDARSVMLVERCPAPGRAPHRIEATFSSVAESQGYRHRTLRAVIDLAGAPTGLYHVIAYNEPWWSLRPTVRFEITRAW